MSYECKRTLQACEKNNDRVMEVLGEAREPVTIRNVSEKCGLSTAAVWRTMNRLIGAGQVRMVAPMSRLGYRGSCGATYEAINAEEMPIRRRSKAAVRVTATRDPLVAAFFGEYRRAA